MHEVIIELNVRKISFISFSFLQGLLCTDIGLIGWMIFTLFPVFPVFVLDFIIGSGTPDILGKLWFVAAFWGWFLDATG